MLEAVCQVPQADAAVVCGAPVYAKTCHGLNKEVFPVCSRKSLWRQHLFST